MQVILQECINDNTNSSGIKYSAHWNAKLYLHSFLWNITKELVVCKQWYMQFDPFTKKNKFTVLLNKEQMLLYTVC